MTPDRLRALSLRFFKASIYCGIVAVLALIAVPGPGHLDAASTSVKVLAILAVAIMGLTMLLSLISLTTGAVAWRKGTRHCGWIFVSAGIFLIPLGLMLLMVLTV